MNICEVMADLRCALEDAGYKWRDESEKLETDNCYYEFQRTKVIDDSGEIIASCVWIYSILDGVTTGHSYGFPNLIECWITGDEPEPMTVKEILYRLGRTNG